MLRHLHFSGRSLFPPHPISSVKVKAAKAPTMTQVKATASASPSRSITTAEVFAGHIVEQLKKHRPLRNPSPSSSAASASSHTASTPLFVGMQGPQGAGKTTVTRSLVKILREKHGISTAVLSTDDLYRTHAGLAEVANNNPGNALLHGRGQPGTHDVLLGKQTLDAVAAINQLNSSPSSPPIVRLPIFDKSLHDGEGDRSTDIVPVEPTLDVFILEGWSMGFFPRTEESIRGQYDHQHDSESVFLKHRLEHLLTVNRELRAYADTWYPRFEAFLQIAPTSLSHVYSWRLQQEHAMKLENGGRGMTDEQVKAFVDRYIPGYELFLDTVRVGWEEAEEGHGGGRPAPWREAGVTVTIDEKREVLDVQRW